METVIFDQRINVDAIVGTMPDFGTRERTFFGATRGTDVSTYWAAYVRNAGRETRPTILRSIRQRRVTRQHQ
jgi:hypothetical protein